MTQDGKESERSDSSRQSQPQTQLLILTGLPPTINHYYGYRTRQDAGGMARNGPRLQKFPSKEGKSFKKYVALECLAQRIAKLQPKVPLKVEIVFTTKDKRRMDIDNRLKVLLDSLMPCVIEDDCWVWELVVTRILANPERTEVLIKPL